MRRLIPTVILVMCFFFSALAQHGTEALPLSYKKKVPYYNLEDNKGNLSSDASDKIRKHLEDVTENHHIEKGILQFLKRGTNIGKNTLASTIPSHFVFANFAINTIEEFVDFGFEHLLEDSKTKYQHRLNNAARVVIANNINIEITSEKFRKELKALFYESNISPEDYPAIGKEIDNLLLAHVSSHEKELKNIKAQLKIRFKELEEQGLTNAESVKHIKKNLKDFNGKLIDIEKNNKNLQESLLELELDIEKKFLEFENKVFAWQNQVNKDIAEMNEEIAANSNKIKANASKIEKLKIEVKQIDRTLDSYGKKIDILQRLTAENRKLIIKNRVKIDAIGGVLYGEASTAGKLKMIKLELVQFKDSAEEEKEKKRLVNLQNWEKFNYQVAVGGELTEFATNLGSLSAKDAQVANRVLGSLSLVGTFAISYPSNPLGMLQSVNGAFALFGNNNASENNPNPIIMDALREIQGTLNEISKDVKTIDLKLTNFIKQQADFHKQNMAHFAALHQSMEELQQKTDYIMRLLTNRCNALDDNEYSLVNVIKKDLMEIEQLDDYGIILRSYPIEITRILDCIFENTESDNLSALEYIHMTKLDQDIIKDVFAPVKNYTLDIYDDEIITKGLQYISLNTMSHLKMLTGHFQSLPEGVPWQEAFAEMIDPRELAHVVDLNIVFSPYFLLKKNADADDYTSWSLAEIEKEDFRVIKGRVYTQHLRLKRINRIIDYCLAQQSLIAGNKLLPHLYRDLGDFNLTPRKVLAYEAIRKNSIMKFNLSTYILNSTIFEEKSLRELFIKINEKARYKKLSKEDLGDLNKLNISLENNWDFVQVEQEGFYALHLYTKFSKGSEEHDLYLPLDEQLIMSNEMIYPTPVEELLNVKSHLTEKIKELAFQVALNSEINHAYAKEFNTALRN